MPEKTTLSMGGRETGKGLGEEGHRYVYGWAALLMPETCLVLLISYIQYKLH